MEVKDGYIKLYRHKKDLVFIKTKQIFALNEDINIFSNKDDEIYTRKYLYLFPSTKKDLERVSTKLRSIKDIYTKYRKEYTKKNIKNELYNKININNIQYLSDPFKDEELFLKMKKKIVSEYKNEIKENTKEENKNLSEDINKANGKQLDIFFILRGIENNYISQDDREVLDFFKNIFYEFFIKHIHRVFKEIGDICCTIVKESIKLIKKDIESRRNLLNSSSNSSYFNCFKNNQK